MLPLSSKTIGQLLELLNPNIDYKKKKTPLDDWFLVSRYTYYLGEGTMRRYSHYQGEADTRGD